LKKFVLIASLGAALAFGTAAEATQFVTNGNFTTLPSGVGYLNTVTATGWTNSGYNFVMTSATTGSGGVKLWDAANGGSSDNTWNGLAPSTPTPVGNFAALDGDYSNGPIAQTITGLTVGQTYTLSFQYAFAQQKNYTGATIQNLVMNFGAAGAKTGTGDHPWTFAGGPTWTSAGYNLPTNDFSGWMSYTTTLTATSTSEVLSFLALGNLPVPPFALVTDISLTGSVPEPASWGMMLIGLGAIGAAARRRRRVLAAT
jgi:hypothetical protein